jgi:hypothetical protein
LHVSRLRFSLHVIVRYTLGPLGNAISYTSCKHMINEFNHKMILSDGIVIPPNIF